MKKVLFSTIILGFTLLLSCKMQEEKRMVQKTVVNGVETTITKTVVNGVEKIDTVIGNSGAIASSDLPADIFNTVQSGGVQMIPIKTPVGNFKVWTKKFGNNPTIKSCSCMADQRLVTSTWKVLKAFFQQWVLKCMNMIN